MPRQPDTMNRSPQPARNLHVDNRQRNGNPHAFGEYFIQAAIRRVIVLLLVALKTEFFEQVLVCRVNELLPVGFRAQAFPNSRA